MKWTILLTSFFALNAFAQYDYSHPVWKARNRFISAVPPTPEQLKPGTTWTCMMSTTHVDDRYNYGGHRLRFSVQGNKVEGTILWGNPETYPFAFHEKEFYASYTGWGEGLPRFYVIRYEPSTGQLIGEVSDKMVGYPGGLATVTKNLPMRTYALWYLVCGY